MNSEADSSFSVSTWNTSKIVNNSIWTHFCWSCDNDLQHDSKFRYCIFYSCFSHFSSYYTYISINMQKYLQWYHKIIIESSVDSVQEATLKQLEQLKQLYLNAKSSDQTEEIDVQVFEKQLNQNIINKILIFLIAVWNLLFQMIEWSEFHTFCQVLNSKLSHFITMTHSQIEWKIREVFETYKNIVQKKLQSIFINIYFSVDIWTFLNKHFLLTIINDFVEHIEEKYMKTFFVFCKMKNHNKKDQFIVFFLILKNYNITWNLEAVITDNSSTNNTLCWKIETHFLQVKNIVWNSEH